jgi:uncharacterized membrane protein
MRKPKPSAPQAGQRRPDAGKTPSKAERQRIAAMLEASRQRVKPIVKREREAERITPAVANLRLK